MSRIKKVIVAVMTISVLSVWFVLPNVAHAKTVTIEGRNINTSFIKSSSSAIVSISYSEGPGKVKAIVNGYAYKVANPQETKTVSDSNGYNSTPGGASASVSASTGYVFYTADSKCLYEVYINDTTYSGEISE